MTRAWHPAQQVEAATNQVKPNACDAMNTLCRVTTLYDTSSGCSPPSESQFDTFSQQSLCHAGVSGDPDEEDASDEDDDEMAETRDCIGAGKLAPLQPLAGVLAKLQLRRQQAIDR